MMNTYALIEGLQILEKYSDVSHTVLCATNNEIQIIPTDRPLSLEDFLMLSELGWIQVDNMGEPCDGYYQRYRWVACLI